MEVIVIFEEIVCSKLPSAFFRDLFLWEQARPKAVANYDKYKGEMHSLTATMVGKDLQAAQLGKAWDIVCISSKKECAMKHEQWTQK